MTKNEDHQREFVADKVPLVSVIIPMYNAAKFIPQTLESLLYQTLKDFEVVIVDDCSTDNSVKVVESFAPKFAVCGVALRGVKLSKNTGMPGIPRNVGIQVARGKYIAFLDSDDLFTKTALEELTTLAEKYQANVVRANSWFVLWEGKKKYADDPAFTDMNELTNSANYITKSEFEPKLLTTPKLLPEDIAERVKDFTNWGTLWTSWLSFCRRDFLLSNQILFPNMNKSEDAPFVLACCILAKNFLRVPNAVYIQRPRAGSVSKIDENIFNAEDYFHENIAPIIRGLNELERVMKKSSFFAEHLDYRYSVLDFFCRKTFSWLSPMQELYTKTPVFNLNEIVKREFHSDDAIFSAYLFNMFNIHQLQIAKLQEEIKKLRRRLKKLKNPK